MRQLTILAALCITGLAPVPAEAQQRFASQAGPLLVEQVAKGLANPWGLAFLPDGRMLVTERPGSLRIVGMDGAVSRPLPGVPQVSARNQGGLLDVRLDPDFARNRALYLCFAEPRAGGNGTSLARATLSPNADALTDVKVIFRQDPTYQGGHHFGCRIVPDRAGALFLTLGDRYNLRDEAQNPQNHLGKIVRVMPDGAIPLDNPAPSGQHPGWKPEIWSIGHRNVQGAALHPDTGQLWTAEHGARGGDEINTPKKGRNYGWPVITYGIDYSGVRIGEGVTRAGMEQPVFYWDPSIAPSGAAFYTGEAFPAWKGSLFIGALAGQRLARLTIRGEAVAGEEQLLMGLDKRIRDVRQGPDGFLYLLIDDANGEVLRLRPGG
jgi:glucose/arabinose dehydrogenase